MNDSLATSHAPAASSSHPLSSFRWKLKELAGTPIGDSINGQEPYITFELSDSSVGGRFGCNRFGGKFIAKGDSIQFADFFSTKMACQDMKAETVFLQLIDSVDRYMISGKELHLLKKEERIARFEGKTP